MAAMASAGGRVTALSAASLLMQPSGDVLVELQSVPFQLDSEPCITLKVRVCVCVVRVLPCYALQPPSRATHAFVLCYPQTAVSSFSPATEHQAIYLKTSLAARPCQHGLSKCCPVACAQVTQYSMQKLAFVNASPVVVDLFPYAWEVAPGQPTTLHVRVAATRKPLCVSGGAVSMPLPAHGNVLLPTVPESPDPAPAAAAAVAAAVTPRTSARLRCARHARCVTRGSLQGAAAQPHGQHKQPRPPPLPAMRQDRAAKATTTPRDASKAEGRAVHQTSAGSTGGSPPAVQARGCAAHLMRMLVARRGRPAIVPMGRQLGGSLQQHPELAGGGAGGAGEAPPPPAGRCGRRPAAAALSCTQEQEEQEQQQQEGAHAEESPAHAASAKRVRTCAEPPCAASAGVEQEASGSVLQGHDADGAGGGGADGGGADGALDIGTGLASHGTACMAFPDAAALATTHGPGRAMDASMAAGAAISWPTRSACRTSGLLASGSIGASEDGATAATAHTAAMHVTKSEPGAAEVAGVAEGDTATATATATAATGAAATDATDAATAGPAGPVGFTSMASAVAAPTAERLAMGPSHLAPPASLSPVPVATPLSRCKRPLLAAAIPPGLAANLPQLQAMGPPYGSSQVAQQAWQQRQQSEWSGQTVHALQGQLPTPRTPAAAAVPSLGALAAQVAVGPMSFVPQVASMNAAISVSEGCHSCMMSGMMIGNGGGGGGAVGICGSSGSVGGTMGQAAWSPNSGSRPLAALFQPDAAPTQLMQHVASHAAVPVPPWAQISASMQLPMRLPHQCAAPHAPWPQPACGRGPAAGAQGVEAPQVCFWARMRVCLASCMAQACFMAMPDCLSHCVWL